MLDRPFDLQMFAQEKTEQATPKKREEARKKGQVFKSREINSALILIATFIALKYFITYIMESLKESFVYLYNNYISYKHLTIYDVRNIFLFSAQTILKAIFPVAASALVIGVVVSYAQVGFLFSAESINFKLERINPIEGFKNIFSKRSLVELVKSLFKLSVIGWVVYITLKGQMSNMSNLFDYSFMDGIKYVGNLSFDVALRTGFILLIMSAGDYAYQKWEYENSLKMTKQEVKDEYKQIEGDPYIKGKVREKQRSMAMGRMMQEIPKADVVITNPTHYAVAIKYDENKSSAPIVIAKGVDYIAEQIKKRALENSINIFENPSLARGLYKSVEIGDEIPEKYYQAVAEILAFIYSLKTS
jgi:flagellar biosynthetic protein FlhB